MSPRGYLKEFKNLPAAGQTGGGHDDASQPPLLRELIDIPEEMSDSDFVLKLAEGVTNAESTLRDHVITDDLVANFDRALGLIKAAVNGHNSKAAYLHGSFGAGKSHFMAVLHALLRGEGRPGAEGVRRAAGQA